MLLVGGNAAAVTIVLGVSKSANVFGLVWLLQILCLCRNMLNEEFSYPSRVSHPRVESEHSRIGSLSPPSFPSSSICSGKGSCCKDL